MSVKSFADLLCEVLPSEKAIFSDIAYLESLITKKSTLPETLSIEQHDMYNQKRVKEQAVKFLQRWFY